MSRPVLMLLPGLMWDRMVWDCQIASLSASADCLVAGYGELDSIAAMAHTSLRQAPARFALAGHSMGGRVALEIMRPAPQRVTRLALLETGVPARASGDAGQAQPRDRY